MGSKPIGCVCKFTNFFLKKRLSSVFNSFLIFQACITISSTSFFFFYYEYHCILIFSLICIDSVCKFDPFVYCRGFINDSLYAETFSRSRWSNSSWGPRRIKQVSSPVYPTKHFYIKKILYPTKYHML